MQMRVATDRLGPWHTTTCIGIEMNKAWSSWSAMESQRSGPGTCRLCFDLDNMLESSPWDIPSLAVQGILLSSFISASYVTWKTFRPRSEHSLRSVAILVLGDIGRSPRMMYHAQSFAENGFLTDLIGYGGMLKY